MSQFPTLREWIKHRTAVGDDGQVQFIAEVVYYGISLSDPEDAKHPEEIVKRFKEADDALVDGILRALVPTDFPALIARLVLEQKLPYLSLDQWKHIQDACGELAKP